MVCTFARCAVYVHSVGVCDKVFVRHMRDVLYMCPWVCGRCVSSVYGVRTYPCRWCFMRTPYTRVHRCRDDYLPVNDTTHQLRPTFKGT